MKRMYNLPGILAPPACIYVGGQRIGNGNWTWVSGEVVTQKVEGNQNCLFWFESRLYAEDCWDIVGK
ncbi:hypothetical protein DPMN_014926 [Dreissena polymorpha]|uniref:Uncharacterized protein n=1 Tax=Dreissena polymorpha TaxID=45954 RepID=A0A9D4S5Q0_DREPO|nr:hypothetical protein DPMN_014926 [Dreissena polymorpha]